MSSNTQPLLPHFDDFLLYLQTNNYSQKTIYNYERDLTVFEKFLGETGGLFSNVAKETINQYKAHLNSIDRHTAKEQTHGNKLASFSVNRHLSSLRSYLRYLIEMDYPSPIAPDVVTLIRQERKHPRVPDLHELVKLIEAPSTLEKNIAIATRNRAMLETLFSTGMRISELLSLNREQIDESGRIFIRGKGKKERFVYLTPRAFTHIKMYLRIRNDDSPALFIPYRGRNTKTETKNKKRISSNYLQDRIKRYRELLRINVPISAHTLRHGFATYLAEQGANPAAIQILLGHESLDTTTRYVHASDRYAEKVHSDFHPLKHDNPS